MRSPQKDKGTYIVLIVNKKVCLQYLSSYSFSMLGKIYNVLKFPFIDLSINGILSDPQHDDAIWCAKANPDCSDEFIKAHCRKYCQSTQTKSKSILKLLW